MNPSSDELIHAVLDGEASASERAELERRLEADPSLRAKFDATRDVFAMLEVAPAVDPPAGLVESILARATLPESRRDLSQPASRQPFARSSVIGTDAVAAKAVRGVRTPRARWFSTLVHHLQEIVMSDPKSRLLSTNRGKLLVTAGVAAVALVAITTVVDFPPGATSTSGAIVPAERHRAPQNTAADINVGPPGGAGATSSAATGASANDATGQASRVPAGAASNDAAGVVSRVPAGAASTDAAGPASRVPTGVASATAGGEASKMVLGAASSDAAAQQANRVPQATVQMKVQ